MDSNKNKIFAVIAIGALLLLLIGSTFAYFAAQGGDASQTDVNVLTHTVDSLVFETGDALSITADQNTFAQGKGNQTDSTFARATLKANSSTNIATDHYYVYLAIDENTFEYTTESKTAELILTINKVEGETKTPLTSIDGLNYVTVGSVSGFDITEVKGLKTILNNQEITSTGTKIDEWEVILTLINLDSNQNANAGKSFNGILTIQKDESFAGHIVSLHTTDESSNGLYYHNGSHIALEDMKDFNNFDAFKIGDVMDANDNSYRYAGGNPNNWVCFGADEKVCPDNNLYRIIGVFGHNVKLIKADYANAETLGKKEDFTEVIDPYYLETYKGKLSSYSYYYWSGSEDNDSNDWTISTLNTDVLNGSYLNLLEDKWENMIENYQWQIGGNRRLVRLMMQPAKTYKHEIINPITDRKINAKVGLMYLNDYGFAASSDYWHYRISSYSDAESKVLNNNWLDLGLAEFVITPNTYDNNLTNVFSFEYDGGLIDGASNDLYSVRPTFYLKSSVTFTSGSGTETDPYRIAQ